MVPGPTHQRASSSSALLSPLPNGLPLQYQRVKVKAKRQRMMKVMKVTKMNKLRQVKTGQGIAMKVTEDCLNS